MSDDMEKRVQILEQRLDSMYEWVEDLERSNNELTRQVDELKELVNPDPGNVEYEQLTKAQKVRRIRQTLVDNAGNRGVSQLKYKEIMMLFDGHPSPGHCYDLMERAAEAEGFAYDSAGQGNGEKRIRVKADDVNDETLFHAANNEVAA